MTSKIARAAFRIATPSSPVRGPGRPPAGPRGQRVSEYPQVMIRLPHDTKESLVALSSVTGTPVWQLVDRAVRAYIQQLPAAERKLVADVKIRRTRVRSEN